MLKRILAVIVSASILALAVSVLNYVPQNQRESDVYYLGIVVYFLSTIWVYLLFYLVIGVPSSWVIDNYRQQYKEKTNVYQYFIGVALYSLVGLFFGTAYYFILGSKQAYLYNFIETLGFWAIALFLYFQALWVLERGYLAKYVKG
ncbi:hypothetical protein BBI08_03890 [Planococcus halocryophilus]|uniref:Uncharacterized protein n=1 Tax=Planococcus halocryophilus TaxID=1215089 RepID=A0A1C7DNF4_9BACL|nr:hypothetical protein [Planococcus halocryophilus]ANU13036.1 hypothetical protein BBI08_03890 [Planococcus halocryophilus]